MAKMNSPSSSTLATLIGDVVDSRHYADRAALHRTVSDALAGVTGGAVRPPAFTVGDEFQGSYRTVGAAIDAALALRLAVGASADIRFGVGWGTVTMLDDHIEDGPGWWSAREAIEWVAGAQRQPTTATLRTAYRSGVPGGPDPGAVNAALLCRDQLLGSLDARSLRLFRGLLNGTTKKELAELEGISPSAVSQRSVRDGLDTLVLATEYLRGVR